MTASSGAPVHLHTQTETARSRGIDIAAEVRGWAWAAVGSLAIAGVFAFLLALSRLPGSDALLGWPVGFFNKGLVIHVVFSLVVWFLAVFAMLSTLAVHELAGARVPVAGLGRHGLTLVALAFPLLFLPAFSSEGAASLNNYVPVIIHRAYYAGLLMLAGGVLLPALRLVWALLTRPRGTPVPPLARAMGAASFIYIAALLSVVLALRWVWGMEVTRSFNEKLFWGGGHVLQFLNVVLLVAGWQMLTRAHFGRETIDPDIFGLALKLLAAITVAAPIFYLAQQPFSLKQTDAFRLLQFGAALPTLLVAFAALSGILAERKRAPLDWRHPVLLALVTCGVVFGIGGVMGLAISGSDTRTPAHYHSMIAATSLVLMMVVLTRVLPWLGFARAADTRLRQIVLLFGYGQLTASIGLFLAGGYGAPRKLPSGAATLVDGAAVGMYLHGIGALLAVIGGALFVYTALATLLGATGLPRRLPERSSPRRAARDPGPDAAAGPLRPQHPASPTEASPRKPVPPKRVAMRRPGY